MPTPDRTEGNEGESPGRSWGKMVVGTKDRQAQAAGLCDGVPEVSQRGHLVLPGHGQEGTCHLAELQALTQQIRGTAYTPAAQLPLVPRHNQSSKGVGGSRERMETEAVQPPSTPREEGLTDRDEVKVGWNPES